MALALAVGGIWLAGGMFGDPAPESASGSRAWRAPVGWTSLPPPPEVREGSSLLWAGHELLLWGGCDPRVDDGCAPTPEGYRFDTVTRRWDELPSAPKSSAWGDAVWTGTEAVFLAGVYAEPTGPPLDGVAYRPDDGSWGVIPEAPIRTRRSSVAVWTGEEIVVWGGGNRDGAINREGAAFNPSSQTWRRIEEAPLGLNLASGVWTGDEVLVFGSLLDHRNWAETETSVGAAYDPYRDQWRTLPPSDLSPQATSAVWAGGQLVAWDYEVSAQEYDPIGDAWEPPVRMPLQFSECYPNSALVDGKVFAFFCGTAALYDPATSSWERVRGGPLDAEIEGDPNGLLEWRFASLESADVALFMLMEGVTVNDRGVPCYGCPGSRLAFWAFRPPA